MHHFFKILISFNVIYVKMSIILIIINVNKVQLKIVKFILHKIYVSNVKINIF